MFFIALVIIALPIWLYIIGYWRRGIYLLLIYMPFAGAVSLSMYPSKTPLIFKDIFFLLPTYITLILFSLLGHNQLRNSGAPRLFTILILLFSSLVTVQMLNPYVANWKVALIGAKVWLFYLPLIFIFGAMIEKRKDLVNLFRLCVVIAWIPCVIGILIFVAITFSGYEQTMDAIYGDTAFMATQGYSRFRVGGMLYRIPSTFTFHHQYYNFTFCMLVPAFALMKMDTSVKWRNFAKISLGLIIVASFLTGARHAFLFVPILLGLIYLFDSKPTGWVRASLIISVFSIMAFYLAGMDPFAIYSLTFKLTTSYGQDLAYGQLVKAIGETPLGIGTGMNTIAARHAFVNEASFGWYMENYYAKAVRELGVIGLMLISAIFFSILAYGYKNHAQIRDAGLRSCSIAINAFIFAMIFSNLKGVQLDFDPINVYFWMFTGILLKLKFLPSDEVFAAGRDKLYLLEREP